MRRDAESGCRSPPGSPSSLFLVPFVGAVLVMASRLDLSLFRFITGEDRLLEWSQFAAYAATVPIALAVALQLRRDSEQLGAASSCSSRSTALLIAGEEISWGQHVFGVETLRTSRRSTGRKIGAHNISSMEYASSSPSCSPGCTAPSSPGWPSAGRSPAGLGVGRGGDGTLFALDAGAVTFGARRGRKTRLHHRRRV